MIKCYACGKYRYYVVGCHNKKRNEEANLTFTYDEALALMLTAKKLNLLILNEEKVIVNILVVEEDEMKNKM